MRISDWSSDVCSSDLIAGQFAFALFALGIIGTGLLAVPVLAGSAAYAVTEMVGKVGRLDAKPLQARLFYATIAVTTIAGAALSSVVIVPVRALFWAAVVIGVLATPLMFMIMLIVQKKHAMGSWIGKATCRGRVCEKG